MAVRKVSPWDIDRLFTQRSLLESFLKGQAVEWYVDDGQETIGVIGVSNAKDGCPYVVLRRNPQGEFQSTNVCWKTRNVQDAHRQLHVSMGKRNGSSRRLSQ
jgi:hypothetical protein